MFISDRWISIKQVRDELSSTEPQIEPENTISFDPDEHANKLTWQFCELATSVRLYHPDNTTTKAPKDIVEKPSSLCSSGMNDHVDLNDGWLGSGRKREEIAICEDDAGYIHSSHHEYGKNLGSLVVFEKKEFLKFKAQIEVGTPCSAMSRAAIRKAIIEHYKAGLHQNKARTKEAVAPYVSRNEFKLAWREATDLEPQLKKTGPKSGLKGNAKSNT